MLLQIGDRIGGLPTFALVVLTGLLGAALARKEGLRVLREWQASVRAGRVPTDGVIDGALALLGCALLISPGVITDVFGLVLLVPPSRRLVARWVRARVQGAIERGAMRVVSARGVRVDPFAGQGPFQRGPSDVIDVAGEPVEPEAAPPRPLPKSTPGS